jgi:hypothetical protein
MCCTSRARLPHRRRSIPKIFLAVLALSCGRSASAEIVATLHSAADRDDYHLGTMRVGADLAGGGPELGWILRGRWYSYSLDRDLVGIRPFSGSEPAAELSGHWLDGLWWIAGKAGFQGTTDSAGAVGSLILARAFVFEAGTLTPHLDVGRQPFALSALPLSLGLTAWRAEAALAWRASKSLGELVVRTDRWEAMTVPGRVENPVLATIPANRRTMASAYLISQGFWLQGGALAKVQHAQSNTLVATQITPDYRYTWYPVSIPLWAWEAAVIGRVAGRPLEPLEMLLQVQIPLVSRETRRWESSEQSSWGTAAWEAKAEAAWNMTRTTRVFVAGALFAKPWANWDVVGSDAYRQVSLQAGITQRL